MRTILLLSTTGGGVEVNPNCSCNNKPSVLLGSTNGLLLLTKFQFPSNNQVLNLPVETSLHRTLFWPLMVSAATNSLSANWSAMSCWFLYFTEVVIPLILTETRFVLVLRMSSTLPTGSMICVVVVGGLTIGGVVRPNCSCNNKPSVLLGSTNGLLLLTKFQFPSNNQVLNLPVETSLHRTLFWPLMVSAARISLLPN